MTRRVCAEHGCPNPVENVPDIYYCEEHDAKHADIEEQHRDDVEHELGEMMRRAVEVVLSSSDESDPERYLSAQVADHIPAVLRALEKHETGSAIKHALWVGRMTGLLEKTLPEWQQLEQEAPHAVLGRKVAEGARTGGFLSRKRPPGMTVDQFYASCRTRLEAMHQQFPNVSWSTACDRVAEKFNTGDFTITGKAIRTNLPDTKW